MLFKTLISTVLLSLSLSAAAQIEAAGSVEEAKAQAEIKCKQGCVVLSPAEVAAIEDGIRRLAEQAFFEGYNEGKVSWKTNTKN